MDEEILHLILPCSGLDLFQAVSVRSLELRQTSPAQRFEMGTAAQLLTHVMGYRAQISSGGDARAEAGAIPRPTVISSSVS